MAACAVALGTAFVATVAPAFAEFGDRPLRKDSRGHDVRVLQSWLTHLGHRTTVDGVFGRSTQRSVRLYERAAGLHVDGRVSRREARGLRRRVEQPARAPAGQAVLSADGRTAVAPAGAPAQVHAAVAAANRIARKPYRYGGGHSRFRDSGYDCSGAVSYVLHGAGLLRRPRDSRGLMSWRQRGAGGWITVYSNPGHAFLVIAGLRFDTSGRGESGRAGGPSGVGTRLRRATRGWALIALAALALAPPGPPKPGSPGSRIVGRLAHHAAPQRARVQRRLPRSPDTTAARLTDDISGAPLMTVGMSPRVRSRGQPPALCPSLDECPPVAWQPSRCLRVRPRCKSPRGRGARGRRRRPRRAGSA